MSIELAIRSGLPFTGPTDAMAVTLALVTTPPLVGPDGGLDAEERNEWSDR